MRGVLIDHRRHAFAAATLVAAVLVVLGWAVLRAPGGAGAASNRLNLVVILADDQRWPLLPVEREEEAEPDSLGDISRTSN